MTTYKTMLAVLFGIITATGLIYFGYNLAPKTTNLVCVPQLPQGE